MCRAYFQTRFSLVAGMCYRMVCPRWPGAPHKGHPYYTVCGERPSAIRPYPSLDVELVASSWARTFGSLAIRNSYTTAAARAKIKLAWNPKWSARAPWVLGAKKLAQLVIIRIDMFRVESAGDEIPTM